MHLQQWRSQTRSHTFCGIDPRDSQPASISSGDSEDTPERELEGEEDTVHASESSATPPPASITRLEPMKTLGLSSQERKLPYGDNESRVGLVRSAVLVSQDRCRSHTPTPAICIEPELEWTAHMLYGPDSEIVTSDTSLAKATGSTSVSNLMYLSDDDSVDGLEEEEEEEDVFREATPYEEEAEDMKDEGSGLRPDTPGEAAAALPDTDSVRVCVCVYMPCGHGMGVSL